MRVLNLSQDANELLFLIIGFVLITIGAVALIDKYVEVGVMISTVGFVSFYIGLGEDVE